MAAERMSLLSGTGGSAPIVAETPEDRVWIEILMRDEETRALDVSTARTALRANGFPDRVIETYLRVRAT